MDRRCVHVAYITQGLANLQVDALPRISSKSRRHVPGGNRPGYVRDGRSETIAPSQNRTEASKDAAPKSQRYKTTEGGTEGAEVVEEATTEGG